MKNKERLIYANEVIEEIDEIIGNINFSSPYQNDIHLIVDGLERARDCVLDAIPVDAVLVDDIILHHILIDENGIPEVKLQFGDRELVLRRENDPVDVVEVAHGYWEIDTSYMPFLSTCSECGALYTIDGAFDWNYCPDCGTKMDLKNKFL